MTKLRFYLMKIKYRYRLYFLYLFLYCLICGLIVVLSLHYVEKISSGNASILVEKIDSPLALALVLCVIFLILCFLLTLVFLKYQRSVRKLNKFVLDTERNADPNELGLNDELRSVANSIKEIYEKIRDHEEKLLIEKEKLLEHFSHAEVGIAFFDEELKSIYTNPYFIQYLNVILIEPVQDVYALFQSPVFEDIVKFINNPDEDTEFSIEIKSGLLQFVVKIIIFDDRSIEIIIKEVSEDKQAEYDKITMSNNIAHELKTPISSIRGYLETIKECPDLPEDKRQEFVGRAMNQVLRLSDIVQDITLLSNISTAPQYFKVENINILSLCKQLLIDYKDTIREADVNFVFNFSENVVIKGNKTLIYSLFFNLGNNAYKYAGAGSTVTITNYLEDDNYYYFSYADDGVGIEEKYLSSIFERFYRVAEGRTRDMGGSGLGLSIVKDAVLFHHGTILAKSREGGGLEFLFTLRKY